MESLKTALLNLQNISYRSISIEHKYSSFSNSSTYDLVVSSIGPSIFTVRLSGFNYEFILKVNSMLERLEVVFGTNGLTYPRSVIAKYNGLNKTEKINKCKTIFFIFLIIII
jgi:hypothetical protein